MKALVGAIDQGTSSSRFLVFDPEAPESVVCQHQIEFDSSYPKDGWVDQDPNVLVDTVKECIKEVHSKLGAAEASKIKAVGITNQRETTVVWDFETGAPLHPAIVWLDARTQETVDKLLKKTSVGIDVLRPKCGLPLSTYFSAVKLRWLLDHIPDVKEAYDDGRLCFGTVDSWLIWNLAKGSDNKARHLTDVTNASRTMLMDLQTLEWDKELIDFFDFDLQKLRLPKICSSSEFFGFLDYAGSPWPHVPVSGILGDQQAALVGQHCLQPGTAKNTYGTGCFLLYNVGRLPVTSGHGMLSTVAYRMGPDAEPIYALEGSIATAGAAVKWLRDNLGIISTSSEVETEAKKVKDNGGVYFVPALSGLFAPHWRPDARGTVCGITQFSTRSHLCRATLEAVCYQTREILESMSADSGIKLSKLLVDGGMAANDLMMQMQADFLDLAVLRPSSVETTALGAAIAAGNAVGVWDLDRVASVEKDCERRFLPQMDPAQRESGYATWKKAIERSLGWSSTGGE